MDKALEIDPEHEQALLNSAILLQELGRADLRKIARERLLKLLAKDGKFYLFRHKKTFIVNVNNNSVSTKSNGKMRKTISI